MAINYLYYRGCFMGIDKVLNEFDDLDLNIVLVDKTILSSVIEVRNLCSALIRKFNFADHPEPTPVIIVSNVEDEGLKRTRNSFTSIFVNSSIWFWYINLKDQKKSMRINEINTSVNHYSKELNLFKNVNAREYIDFQLRVQSQNFLTGSGGHSQEITPIIYADELLRKHDTTISRELNFFFDEQKENNDYKTKGIIIRILLIDDKINCTINGNGIKNHCNCKALIIKNLLELKLDKVKQKDVCWRTEESFNAVKIFQKGCTAGCPECFNNDISNSRVLLDIKNDNNNPKIQIIAVKTLEIARQLLDCNEIRFDLIMMDYLLDWKKDKPEEREYATEFWGNGIEKYFEFSKEAKQKGSEYEKLTDTYDKIKSNRGPMNRLWIFPITAFNQTFIDDLRNRGIRLNDYYWYLSRGADPINTPYLFIYTLNKFLQLMLSEAIFSLYDLSNFLKKSIEKWENLSKKENAEKKVNAEKIRILMTTEYIYFINQYAMREQIKRDLDSGSLFAHYVNENFFKKEEEKDLIKISDSIRRFYHSLAYGEDRDYLKAQERLFRMLDLLKTKIEKPKIGEKESVDLIKQNLSSWENKFNTIIQHRFNATR